MGEGNNGTFNLRSVARSLSLKRKGNPANGGNLNGSGRHAHLGTSSGPSQPSTSASPRPVPSTAMPALEYSSLHFEPPRQEAAARPKRNGSTTHRRAQPSYDFLDGNRPSSKGAKPKGLQLPLRASRSDESLAPVETVAPPKLQSTARGAPCGPPAYGAQPPITSPYVVKSPKLDPVDAEPQLDRDFLQNVMDHMRANADLIGHGPFYSVQRGWKKGIYVSRQEADRQTRNFPGPVIKTFENLDQAIAFLTPDVATAENLDEDQDEEVLERARIFSDLASSGQVSLRRAISLSSERRDARVRFRNQQHGGATSSVKEQTPFSPASPALQPSLPAVLKPASPVPAPMTAEALQPSSQPVPVGMAGGPSRLVQLLPVRNLAVSTSFYTEVLGMTCTSQHEGLQALLASSSGATICLRSLEAVAAPLPAGGSVLARSSSMNRSGSASGGNGRARLPSMNEDGEQPLHQVPDSPSKRGRPAPPRSPVPPPPPVRSATLPMSGITVLVEHPGSLEALHGSVSSAIHSWTQDARRQGEAKLSARRTEGAKVLCGIEDKAWGCQEFHVSDPDGHRLVFTTALR